MTQRAFRPNRRQALAAGAAFFAACGSPRRPPQDLVPEPFEKPVNVVVFLADALRTDHLGCYGYKKETSPAIDRFARSATLFERCYAAASWTKPAVASLFTATPPAVHQMVFAEWCADTLRTLSPGLRSMDEPFAAGGYDTAWFLSNLNARREFGLGRGFEFYQPTQGQGPAVQMDSALSWIQERAKAPFYLFIHEIDPHDPYLSTTEEFHAFTGKTHEEWLRELPGADAERLANAHRLGWTERREATGRLDLDNLSPQSLDYVRTLYDTEIRRADSLFERLCKGLEDAGLYDNTLIVFTSDHGHAFGEHGNFYHGNSVYNEELHVPLIAKSPGADKGRRVTAPCSQCDIAPTLLALTGQDPLPKAQVQGRPLLLRNGASCIREERPVFAYFAHCRSEPVEWDMALFTGPVKFIRRHGGISYEVFNLEADPREEHNRFASLGTPNQRDVRLLRESRDARRQHIGLAEELPPGKPVAGLSEENEKALKALGYL